MAFKSASSSMDNSKVSFWHFGATFLALWTSFWHFGASSCTWLTLPDIFLKLRLPLLVIYHKSLQNNPIIKKELSDYL